jgi:hypothetical protein
LPATYKEWAERPAESLASDYREVAAAHPQRLGWWGEICFFDCYFCAGMSRVLGDLRSSAFFLLGFYFRGAITEPTPRARDA